MALTEASQSREMAEKFSGLAGSMEKERSEMARGGGQTTFGVWKNLILPFLHGGR